MACSFSFSLSLSLPGLGLVRAPCLSLSLALSLACLLACKAFARGKRASPTPPSVSCVCVSLSLSLSGAAWSASQKHRLGDAKKNRGSLDCVIFPWAQVVISRHSHSPAGLRDQKTNTDQSLGSKTNQNRDQQKQNIKTPGGYNEDCNFRV